MLMPPTRVHSSVMFRISDCRRNRMRFASSGAGTVLPNTLAGRGCPEKPLRASAPRIFGPQGRVPPMKVVVTGGSGQLGSLVLERLVSQRKIKKVVSLDL